MKVIMSEKGYILWTELRGVRSLSPGGQLWLHTYRTLQQLQDCSLWLLSKSSCLDSERILHSSHSCRIHHYSDRLGHSHAFQVHTCPWLSKSSCLDSRCSLHSSHRHRICCYSHRSGHTRASQMHTGPQLSRFSYLDSGCIPHGSHKVGCPITHTELLAAVAPQGTHAHSCKGSDRELLQPPQRRGTGITHSCLHKDILHCLLDYW